MFSETDILNIVSARIEEDEEPGEKAGGSGHLGFVSYKRAFMKEIAKDSRDCTYWQLIIINRCPKGTF